MKIHYLTFALDLGHTKCCPVHSTSCDLSRTKFEVATSNGSVGDTFTRNVTGGRADRRTTDRLW